MPQPNLRVSAGAVLVVPPFECAWLAAEELQLRGGSGCVSFEVRGEVLGEEEEDDGRSYFFLFFFFASDVFFPFLDPDPYSFFSLPTKKQAPTTPP